MRESLQLKVHVPASKKTPWKAIKNQFQASSTSRISAVSRPVVNSPPPKIAA